MSVERGILNAELREACEMAIYGLINPGPPHMTDIWSGRLRGANVAFRIWDILSFAPLRGSRQSDFAGRVRDATVEGVSLFDTCLVRPGAGTKGADTLVRA
jgi:hypothetical protein